MTWTTPQSIQNVFWTPDLDLTHNHLFKVGGFVYFVYHHLIIYN
jgi:hypothetical protein